MNTLEEADIELEVLREELRLAILAAQKVVIEKSESLPGFVAYVDDYKVGKPNVSYMDWEAAERAAKRFIERWDTKGLDAALAMRS